MKTRLLQSAFLICMFSLFVMLTDLQGQERTAAKAGVTRMRRLLGLPQKAAPPKVEILSKTGDDEVLLEDLKIQADQTNWIPAIVAKPKKAAGRMPAIICLPGTGGTRQQLTSEKLQLSERPRTGWARALAAEGFVTISLDYRGSPARDQNIYLDAVRKQLEGGSFMGVLVQEVLRTVDYLETRPDVDRAKIGITGFSLGGAMTWYAAAADARFSVVVPVCSGAGTYEALTADQKRTSYHSQYFYPAGFLKIFPGDQPDVFKSMAPRAVLVVGRDQDQGMPVEGLRRLEKEVGAAYARAGVGDRFAVHITAGDHTYTPEMFDQVKSWFRRFLK